jgi:hypothetical protein
MITKLKGGSLSSTYLHDDGKKFIRKNISLSENREYGYVRWYSQLKKLQRYNTMYPDLFPKVLNVSSDDSGTAYFDLEYMEGFKDIKTIFGDSELNTNQLEKINTALWTAFSQLHSTKYSPNTGAPNLYLQEEVVQKIIDANKNESFADFYNRDSYVYNGQKVNNLKSYLPELISFFSELNFTSEETIHGNPTLENTLYSFEEDRIVFVDPYEESIIDSKFLDYSQVLQCSRSYYGFINDESVVVNGNSVEYNGTIPNNFLKFNEIFESEIQERKTKEIVDVLEATQFIRMLPFKCLAGDVDKAKFFYVHACYLLGKVL